MRTRQWQQRQLGKPTQPTLLLVAGTVPACQARTKRQIAKGSARRASWEGVDRGVWSQEKAPRTQGQAKLGGDFNRTHKVRYLLTPRTYLA